MHEKQTAHAVERERSHTSHENVYIHRRHHARAKVRKDKIALNDVTLDLRDIIHGALGQNRNHIRPFCGRVIRVLVDNQFRDSLDG